MVTSPKVKQLKLPFLKCYNAWYFENEAKKQGFKWIAGIDEAGRGPLAGPVVAAAVILPVNLSLPGVDDSKRLTHKQRLELYDEIQVRALAMAVGVASNDEIDRFNVLQATFVAMKRALGALRISPDYVLVDGNLLIPGISIPQQAIPKGDQLSVSISAASIIAKVKRDSIMDKYHEEYPVYNFRSNKGYGTVEHRKAIRKYGCCPIHRKTFKGVREYLEPGVLSTESNPNDVG